MVGVSDVLDAYQMKARLYPGLICIAPVIITLYLWFPALRTLGGGVATLVIWLGLPFSIASLVRNAGLATQTRLVEKWDGLPTTIMLRHRDSAIDASTKLRYHIYLRKHVVGLSIPTRIQETEDPDSADQAYSSAVKWLLEKTRDTKKYPLVFKQNISYGFSRNMLGIKWVGMMLSIVCIVGNLLMAYFKYHMQLSVVGPGAYLATTISCAFPLMWLLITENWVRSHADAYAKALLATCEVTGT